MPTYRAPLEDVRFLLGDVLRYDETVATLPGCGEAPLDVVLDVLAEAGTFCERELLPLNRVGDEEGCTWTPTGVRTPTGFREAYTKLVAGGWPGLVCEPRYGGSGLPHTAQIAVEELMCATNLSFSTYMLLGQGAYAAIRRHGSDEQRDRLLPKLATGEWCGTMCLTEAHAGTDLGLIRTRAVPDTDGGYRITGTKVFITAGEHDLAPNILHLVLAKLPDAPAGTRGISLFVVQRNADDGSSNGVSCSSVEHKMGIKGSSTCVMQFESARGELIGEPHRGMRYMFTMMNAARLSVGIQGLGLAGAAYQQAVTYARERTQGRSLAGAARPELEADPIIVHPDVRRVLMRIRCQIEAGRALGLWAATELDIAERSADPARKAAAEDLVALLTPVIKAGLTDLGWEATGSALGVFGGSGYIRDTGIEQYVRDARIAQIYEGTNGIQALDLVGRKLPEGAGRLLRRFFHPADAWLDAHRADPALTEFVEPAAKALDALRRCTGWLAERGVADREEAGAAASDYLRLFLLAAYAYLWARMAAAALDPASAASASFRQTKLATGRFFVQRVLPEAGALAREITAGKATLMALADEAF
jgi:alkylation response protein AidB-like acyl-CoA dehydrogenase